MTELRFNNNSFRVCPYVRFKLLNFSDKINNLKKRVNAFTGLDGDLSTRHFSLKFFYNNLLFQELIFYFHNICV